MSGPSFELVYESFTPTDIDRLAELLGSVARGRVRRTAQGFELSIAREDVARVLHRGESKKDFTCLILVSVGEPHQVTDASRAVQTAIGEALGFLPSKALTFSAGCRDELDADALAMLQEKVIERFGGWYVFGGSPPSPGAPPPQRGEVIVDIRDYEAYFGSGPVDPEYAAQYEEYIPRTTLHFIDAKASGLRYLGS